MNIKAIMEGYHGHKTLESFSAGTLVGDFAMYAVAFLEFPLFAMVLVGGAATVIVTEQVKELLERFFKRYPK